VTTGELLEDAAERNAAGGEQDHGVEPEVRDLGDHAVITSAASSPIFRQIWGWPFSNSPAT
jgi:hypothetical protein